MRNEKLQPQSMAEIAEMLGTSAVSVSLALRNSPEVSQALRDRVRQIAMDSGFKPRNYQRRSHPVEPKESFIGKIAVIEGMTRSSDPVAQLIMNSVMKRLNELKISFAVILCDDLYENPALIDGYAGVIYHYCFMPKYLSILQKIQQVAIMHEEITLGPCDNYKPCEMMAGELAAQYLLGQGFKQMILTWEHRMAYRAATHPRLEGFRRKVREAGVELVEIAYERNENAKFYLDALGETLKKFKYQAGIFAFCDQVAYHVCSSLDFLGQKRKLRQLEVISCDNTYMIQNLQPPLPAVDLHIADISARAVDGMLWRLANPQACYQDVMLKPELVLPK